MPALCCGRLAARPLPGHPMLWMGWSHSNQTPPLLLLLLPLL
jgi:hypothetical protein